MDRETEAAHSARGGCQAECRCNHIDRALKAFKSVWGTPFR